MESEDTGTTPALTPELAAAHRRLVVELSEVRDRLERVVSGIDEVLYSLRLRDDGEWQLLFAGPGWAELLGVDAVPADLLMSGWWSAVHPDDVDVFLAAHQDLLQGRQVRLVYRLVGLDGVVRWVEQRAAPRPGHDGAPVVDGSILDISAQRSAAERLAESEQRLSSLVEGVEEFLYTEEILSDRTRCAEYVGPGIEHLLGGALPDGVEPLSALDAAVHPDDRLRVRRAWASAESVEDVDVEYRVVGLDGAARWVWSRLRPREDAAGRLLVDVIVSDVTARREAAEELAEAQRRLRAVLESIDEVLYTYAVRPGEPPEVVFLGPGLPGLLGGRLPDRADPLVLWRAAIHPQDRARVDDARAGLLRGRPADVEYRLVGLDGEVRWAWERARPRPAGDRVLVDGILTDISIRRRAEQELAAARDEAENRSRVDALTGIWNRRHFRELLEAQLERARGDGSTVCVLLLDVDHFKRINDTQGHHVGDQVLIEVAQRLRSVVRDSDTVARWGGEEFIVLATRVPDDEAMRRIAEGVRRSIERPAFAVDTGSLDVRCSVGAARATGAEQSIDELVDAADRALYASKRRGRNRVTLVAELTDADAAEVESVAIKTARTLALSASMREGLSPTHDQQVAELAATVARRLGLSKEAVQRAELGGWLHDVGKTSLPDRLVAAAGELDADDWALVRAHAEIGAQIISGLDGVADAAAAVRHHHERWDGQGYPDGLAGEAIPLEARIVAACDAWSAMTSERTHAGAREWGAAIVELCAGAGSQFDPAVVDELLAALRERRAESEALIRRGRAA